MKKLKSDKGETLVETLISIIIVVISVAVKDAVGSQISFTYEDAEETGTGSMTIPEVSDDSVSVKIYESNGYYYYIKGE